MAVVIDGLDELRKALLDLPDQLQAEAERVVLGAAESTASSVRAAATLGGIACASTGAAPRTVASRPISRSNRERTCATVIRSGMAQRRRERASGVSFGAGSGSWIIDWVRSTSPEAERRW